MLRMSTPGMGSLLVVNTLRWNVSSGHSVLSKIVTCFLKVNRVYLLTVLVYLIRVVEYNSLWLNTLLHYIISLLGVPLKNKSTHSTVRLLTGSTNRLRGGTCENFLKVITSPSLWTICWISNFYLYYILPNIITFTHSDTFMSISSLHQMDSFIYIHTGTLHLKKNFGFCFFFYANIVTPTLMHLFILYRNVTVR